jgi:hypothetical protein
MDTLAMHRTLTEAGFTAQQAEAVVEVLQGGVVTKHDLDMAVAKLESSIQWLDSKLESSIQRLDNKINLILVVAVLAVLAPAIIRLLVG